jgi:DNA-binding response OmpR family regulator
MPNNRPQTLFPAADAALFRESAEILIVDDDENLRYSTTLLLQRHGFIVEAVSNGRAAQDYLKDHEIKLLITDIYMPGCDGLELILAIRRQVHRPWIIAMTGGATRHGPDILAMARGLGSDGELFKPFDGATLLSMVHRFVSPTALPRASAI